MSGGGEQAPGDGSSGLPQDRKPVVSAGEEPSAPAKTPSATTPATASHDVLYVHSSCASGDGYNVVRQRQDRVEVGELRELREGKPVMGEVVRLSQREDHGRLFDVEVLLDGPAQATQPGHVGPAKVSSDAYRDNWDAIFGDPSKGPQPNKTELN